MSSSDSSGHDEGVRPADAAGTKGESDSGDDAVLVISIDERQLMWVALAVVSIFVAINGIALLTWDNSGSTMLPPPFEDGSYPEPPSGSGQGQEMKPSDFKQPSSSSEKGTDTRDRAPRTEGGWPNNDSMELVRGGDALTRVQAFATDFELGKDDTDALVAVVEQTNTAIVLLDTRLASGDIDSPTHSSEVQQLQDDQHAGMLRLLGAQRSSNLLERLRSPTSTASGVPVASNGH
jgi:hypothetical protein